MFPFLDDHSCRRLITLVNADARKRQLGASRQNEIVAGGPRTRSASSRRYFLRSKMNGSCGSAVTVTFSGGAMPPWST